MQCCVLLKKENIFAVRYVNYPAGMISKALPDLAKNFWDFCLDNQILVIAEYLPGFSNEVEDWHSMHLKDTSLWKLDQ